MKKGDKRGRSFVGDDFGNVEQRQRIANTYAGRVNHRPLPAATRPPEHQGLPMNLRISLTQRKRKNKITLADHA